MSDSELNKLSTELLELNIDNPNDVLKAEVPSNNELKKNPESKISSGSIFNAAPRLPPAYLTGQICALCLQATPTLTGVKILALMECAHVICHECAFTIIYRSSSSVHDSGIDCPLCGHYSARIFLTKERYHHHSILESVVSCLWPLVEAKSGRANAASNLVIQGEFFFEKQHKQEFKAVIEKLLGALCSRGCSKRFANESLIWRMFRQLDDDDDDCEG